MLDDRDYRTVFEAAPDATLIVDSKGVIRDLNPQALRMFGWSRGEMEGSSVERLIPKDRRDRHGRHRRDYAKAPRPRPMGQGLELAARRKDGTTFPVEISLSPSKLESGAGRVICTIRDITGWKRSRQLTRLMVTAAENERKRLSRELHDEFLQYLVALKIRVKLLAQEPDEEKRERSRALIAEEIHDTIRGVRRMIRGLLPPELDHAGLGSALASEFRDIRDVHGFEVRGDFDLPDGHLDSFASLALYRIVLEAVNNARRHARVDAATVTVGLRGEVIVAEIRDEGCGFASPDGGASAGVGLVGMRERAEMVGGSVTLHTAPGKGTTVRATVPAVRTGRPA